MTRQGQMKHLSQAKNTPVSMTRFLNGQRSDDCFISSLFAWYLHICFLQPLHPLSGTKKKRNWKLIIIHYFQANNHGSLQIICEYYRLCLPARGSTIKFHPLEHLHPLEFHRPDETVLHIAGSTIDFTSCSTSLELAEVHHLWLCWLIIIPF